VCRTGDYEQKRNFGRIVPPFKEAKMGLLQDLLKEVPLSSVLKERVALAEEKHARAMEENEGYKKRVASLERENESLRAQLPKSDGTLSENTACVLVHLFRAPTREHRDVSFMSRQLVMSEASSSTILID
jgi:hypothetical protein